MIEHQNMFIGGKWHPPASAATIDVTAAHTGQLAAKVPEAVKADVDAAVAAARDAFDEGPWPRLGPEQRATFLERFADALEAKSEELSRLTTLQNGSLLVLNQTLNTPWGINAVRYYAELIRNTAFAGPRECSSADATINRLPVGVVAAIVPWNVSFIAAMSKIAPALAAGCTVVHKPSPETPLEAYVIAEAALQADLPPGVYNAIAADREASEHLVGNGGVNQVSFTGSTPVGRHIAATCSGQMKPCSMELGGEIFGTARHANRPKGIHCCAMQLLQTF